ncbi:MAG: substrate-binding domain-containing protein [Clostridia bacterium]|nr:substrate-binding domain-containing protein [Clostridia bacterium]
MKKLVSIALALVLVLGSVSLAMADMYISVISKGEQHAFWQAVRKGCEDAAAEFGVTMFYYGPPSESDIALQVDALKAEMDKGPAALALASLSTESVMAELQACIELGIPVIGFDSGVPNAPEGSIYATASTNNKNAAALAAEEMMKLEGFVDVLSAATPESPVVIAVLSQDATSESVTGRTTGFVEKMAELAGEIGTVAVVGHDLWAVPADDASIKIHVEISATTGIGDVTNSANAVLNMDGLLAIFCSNEGTVNGLLAATGDGSRLAEGEEYGNIIVAGFDAGAPQKNAIRNNWFVGSVTQDPYRIGYLAVELAFRAASGEAVEDVDTGAKWYTSVNIDDPDIAILVYD